MINQPLFFRFRQGRCLGNASSDDVSHTKPLLLSNDNVKGRVGLLLLHGFKQNAYCMHKIAHAMKSEVFRLVVPVLPGHDTHYTDINSANSGTWFSHVCERYAQLRSECDSVIIVGLSLGGVLAALIEAEFGSSVDQLILLAPAFYPPYVLSAAPLLVSGLSFLGVRHLRSFPGYIRNNAAYDVCFSHAPISSFLRLHQLCRKGREVLPQLTCSIDFFVAEHDSVLRRSGLKKAFKRCGSQQKQWFMLNDSDHVISLDNDLPEVLERVRYHIQRLS